LDFPEYYCATSSTLSITMTTIPTFVKTLISAALLSGVGVMAQTATPPATPPQSGAAQSGSPFAVALAKESLAKGGNTTPTQAQVDAAVASIQAQRASGMGWGQIASSLGLNLGNIVSAYRASDKAADAKGDDRKGSEKDDDSDKDGKKRSDHKSSSKEATESHSRDGKSETRSEGSKSESRSQGGKSESRSESKK
jgi:hypothetical protein